MKVYIGNIDKKFEGTLLNNAYDYAKHFNGENILKLICKKFLLDKNNFVIQKYDSNYHFSCLIKDNLDREDEKIISLSLDKFLLAYLLFHKEYGIVIDNIVIANYDNECDFFKQFLYEHLINEVESYSESVFPSIVYINPYFNDELLYKVLLKNDYIPDARSFKKFIYVPKDKRMKGVIYMDDYECSNFSKQRKR